MLELNKLYLMDCMEGMKEFPDKYFDLAIVDPPYGIGIVEMQNKNADSRRTTSSGGHWRKYKENDWDDKIPSENYFTELKRICNNRIIWGGNYFALHTTKCWLIWDKIGRDNRADGEMAWTSFDKPMKIFRYSRADAYINDCDMKIHPTQKPVQLYKWILHNYAKPDFKIIDTHVGSGSSIIAFLDYGCEWIGFEIDEDYHKTAIKRIEIHQMQTKLF